MLSSRSYQHQNISAMRLFLLVPLLWLSSHVSSTGSAATDCDPMTICSDFQSRRISEDADTKPTIPGFKTESEIGRQRHWEGVVPEHYKLNLNFLNRTHYNGSADITFKLVQPTDCIMINHHIVNPSVDYTLITVKAAQCGAGSEQNLPAAVTTRCIEKATFLEAERTLILDLKQANLKVDSTYVISFPSFRGRSEDVYGTQGAIGLKEATNEEGSSMGNYSALTTIFQMRYARTVFPCFDHPVLKASFELCVERPANVSVASNTLPIASESRSIGANRRRDCFEPTPVIPSYVFTFSLMENYSSESVQAPGGPKIELYAPMGGLESLRWMLNESIPVVQYMERTTRFKFPLKRLAFVAAYPAPFWGVENFGLVTVDGMHMQEKGDLAYTILYHEIVHQWLGNVVTIEDWREICLQEGLTAYFEWNLNAERRNGDLDKKAEQERLSNDQSDYYEPYALKDYAVTQDIANHCFGRPPFFFHTIAKKEGFETIEKFLARLIEKRRYGTADIDLWDQTMEEVSKAGAHAMKGYIKGWFLQPGPLYLTAHKVQGTDCILIRQRVYGHDASDNAPPTVPRPVPLNVKTYGPSGKSMPTILRNLEEKVCDIGNSIFLVDPEPYTLTRKAYTADSYRRLLLLQKQIPTTLTVPEFKNFVLDFCRALVENALPLLDEPSTTQQSDWLEVYQLIRNSSVELPRTCKICLNSKEENQQLRQAQWIWNQWCREVRLNQILGRDYTLNSTRG